MEQHSAITSNFSQSLPSSSQFYLFYSTFFRISRRRKLKFLYFCLQNNVKNVAHLEVPRKLWNGRNILQLFRSQTSIFCVKSAVIIVFPTAIFLGLAIHSPPLAQGISVTHRLSCRYLCCCCAT